MQQAPLNDVTPLNRGEVAVAMLLLVLFVLTFTPIPLRYITP
jgi:membrane-associated protease RseP (regulator of RpoE activity)